MSEAKSEVPRDKPLVKVSESDIETMGREHSLSDFLKNNSGKMKNMSEGEFTKAYAAQIKEKEGANVEKIKGTSGTPIVDGGVFSTTLEAKESEKVLCINKENLSVAGDGSVVSTTTATAQQSNNQSMLNDPKAFTSEILHTIVLKFTTLSEQNTEAPSFTVHSNPKGGNTSTSIGRSSSNGVSVPSDARLALERHATIENIDGKFYLKDGGQECAASLRIGMGVHSNRKWKIFPSCRFSVGNSIFQSNGVNIEGELVLEVIDGPLKADIKIIGHKGATIGRSSDNSIAVPDRELSRRHSRIEYDESTNAYYISDVGSTNGTYVHLVGPYGGSYMLHINDHILVGRTGFSINRFDYGISEEIGHRQTMEDACAIVQNLNITALSATPKGDRLFPQSYFAVYDGHGGAEASSYLSRFLHVNVANAIEEIAPALSSLLAEETACKNHASRIAAQEMTNRLVIEAITMSFTSTDDTFLKTSEFPQHGSTATTALLLGNKLYCSNTGDSRTMLCRNFVAVPLTTDHKPSREDEANRIRAAGGFVIGNRVMGELAVSRAFGDADFKKGLQSIIDEEGSPPPSNDASAETAHTQQDWDQPLIIADPDIEVTTIRGDDQFLLLACDGLFDVFSYDEIVTFVRDNMEKHGDAQRCCQNLSFEAIRKRNSRDNVSVILVILNKWY